jgi:hypothetical protein
MSSESRQNWLSEKCVKEMSEKKLQFAINCKAAVIITPLTDKLWQIFEAPNPPLFALILGQQHV